MRKYLIHIGVTALALLVLDKFIPGIEIDSLAWALMSALVLGIVNTFVRPLLVLLTLPITILTLGLFIFVINVAMFALAAYLVPGFTVHTILAAAVGSLIMSFAGAIANVLD